MRTRIFLLLALVSGLAASAGDRDVADFLFKKAEKAYRARRYEDAVKGYQRARAEFTPLPEAAFGLALALEKLDREAEALAAYRTCVREVETAESPPSKWKSLARRAGYDVVSGSRGLAYNADLSSVASFLRIGTTVVAPAGVR